MSGRRIMGVTAESSDRTDSGRENDPRTALGRVGADLRDARERRGLPLDQLSRTTKISATILRSIEANQLEKLPEPVFLRGFLRAYAREVGLNPEDTVRRYLLQFQPAEEMAEARVPATSQTARALTRAAESTTNAGRRSVRAQWLLIGVLAAGAGYTAIRRQAHPADGTVPSAIPTESVRPPSPVASASPVTRPETATAGAIDTNTDAIDRDRLRLEIHARALCWLSATVDGTRVVYRLMQPGELQTIEVHDEAVLRIGDAGAFAFSINGAPGRPLGRPGDATTVHITTQAYRDLLSR